MSERPPFEESILPYRVTPQLVVRLIELRNVQPDFSRCPYCWRERLLASGLAGQPRPVAVSRLDPSGGVVA